MSSCFRKLQEATKVLSNLGLNVNLCFITSSPDIDNQVKEWDLAKLDADWKSVIAFVAEWTVSKSELSGLETENAREFEYYFQNIEQYQCLLVGFMGGDSGDKHFVPWIFL